jgi:predicted nucleic acid-binding Zn ribbon protein
MAGRILDGVDEFLQHSASGSGGQFLKDWKKDDRLDVILHPKAGVGVLWSHRWYRVTKNKDDKTVVWSQRFNSMDKEVILKRQHFRNDDGSREFPPEVCPFGKMLEWVREMIDTDQINWTDDIFEFNSQKDDVVVKAGGFTGLFQSRKLSDDQLEELKDAKVNIKEAYKQNAGAQVNYVFSVLQYENPDEGWLIAMEGKALGKAMQVAIADEQKRWRGSKTPDRGDYKKNPYVFRWEYDDRKDFDDKYSVVAMPTDSLPNTPQIEDLLEEPPPSISNLMGPSNVALLKLSFQQHWVHSVVPPWDDIFAEAEKVVKGTPEAELPEDFDPANHTKSTSKGKTEVSSRREPPPKNEPEVEMVECDECKSPMPITEFTCKKCGTEYDPVTGMKLEKKPEPPKEEAPARRTRSEAAKSLKTSHRDDPETPDGLGTADAVAPPKRGRK